MGSIQDTSVWRGDQADDLCYSFHGGKQVNEGENIVYINLHRNSFIILTLINILRFWGS